MFGIYKSWFPELAYYEHDDDRRRALRRAGEKAARPRWLPVAILVVLLAYYYLQTVLVPQIAAWLRIERGMGRAVAQGVFLAVLLVPTFWLSRRAVQQELRKQLVGAGLPICLACGFDLRAQVSPRCPECGTPFDFTDFDPARLQCNAAPDGQCAKGLLKFPAPNRKQTRWSFLHMEIPHKYSVLAFWILVFIPFASFLVLYLMKRL